MKNNELGSVEMRSILDDASAAVTKIIRSHTDNYFPEIRSIEDCGGFFEESVRHAITGYMDGSIEAQDNSFAITQEMVVAASDAFSGILNQWLAPETMDKVRAGNAEALRNGMMDTCCTGDHCDSNMAMDQALEGLGYPHRSEEDAPKYARSHLVLWNRAWERSKYLGFNNTTIGS